MIQLFKQSLVSCQGLQAIRARFHARLARWASVEARHQLSALSRRSHVGCISCSCSTRRRTNSSYMRHGNQHRPQLPPRELRTISAIAPRPTNFRLSQSSGANSLAAIHRPALAHPQVASPATHPRFRNPTAAQTDVCRSEGGEALGHGIDERGTLEVEQGTGDRPSPWQHHASEIKNCLGS